MSSNPGEGLSIPDWVLFVVALLGIEALGSYAGRRTAGGNAAKSEYVFGRGGKGGFAAVATAVPTMMLSLARGATGVRAFVGFPAELYYWGVGMWETMFGIVLSLPIVAFIFLPIYYDLGVTSVYQYLELRFRSKTSRCLASATYVMRCIIGLSVTMLTPSIAVSGLVGLPLWICILIVGGLTVLGCLTGGLRGVVIVDAIQGVMLCALSFAITAMGCYHAGGVVEAFKITNERGRFNFFNLSLDPTLRISTISAVVGTLGTHLVVLGCQQNQVQRFCSMPTKKAVVAALLGNIPLIVVVFSFPWLAGVGIFAALADCDPLANGEIPRVDQIVTYFVSNFFRVIPGFIGFFLAIILNGGLNILVSNLNAVGTVVWEDFVSQLPLFKQIKDKSQLFIIRCIAIVSALIITGLTFAAALLPGIVESSMITNSSTSGALLGVFLLAILFPAANSKGAIIGMIVGQAVTFWVAAGALVVDTSGVKAVLDPLPISVAGCNGSVTNDSLHQWTTYIFPDQQLDGSNYSSYSIIHDNTTSVMPSPGSDNPNTNILTWLYSLSFMYYNLLGCTVTVVVGLIISLLTGNPENDAFEERMVHPAVIKLSKWFPGKPRIYAPFGSTLKAKIDNATSDKEVVDGESTEMRTKKDSVVKECGFVNGGLEVDS